jgi:hypothetical protein
MPDRSYFPRLNEHFDVKHIKLDLHKEGLLDLPVHDLAVSLGRIIITFNWPDFKPHVGRKGDCGVIGVSGIDWRRIDTKLTALLMKHGPAYFRGRVRTLGSEQLRDRV